MGKNNDQNERVYYIPRNFAESGKIINGMFYARNLIEAAAITMLLYMVEMQLIPLDLNIRIIIAVITCIPVLLVGAIGIRGYSLTQYGGIYYRFRRGRREMRYRRIMRRPSQEDLKKLGYVPELKASPFKIKKDKKGKADKVSEEDSIENRPAIKDTTLFKDIKKVSSRLLPEGVLENRSNQHFIQDMIPVDRIEDGIIITNDNRYIKILEILPTNMESLHGQDVDQIGLGFEEWWRIAPKNTQIKVITQKKTSFDVIENLITMMKSETNAKAKEMCNNYINYIEQMSQASGLTRRSFLIFEYEKDGVVNNEYYDILLKLDMYEQQARSIFGKIGNRITNPVDPEQASEYLETILYELFNRKTAITKPYQTRKKEVYELTAKAYRTDPIFVESMVHPTYLIGPMGINTSSSNHIIVDGMYFSYIGISSEGYPDSAYLGWVSNIINAGEGYDVDIFIQTGDVDKTLDKIQQKLTMNEINLKEASGASKNSDSIVEVIKAGYFIKNQIMHAHESVYYTSTIITISAETQQELDARKTAMRNLLKRVNYKYSEFTHQMEDCYLSTMPFNAIDRSIFEKNKRNMLTQSVTSLYPFNSFELADKTGVAIGISTDNGSIVYLNLFNNELLNNANMFVVGAAGSGKTFFINLMALRMRLLQIQSVIISPYKGFEFQRACTAMGGSFIKIAIGSEHCINVMDIVVVESEFTNYEEASTTSNAIAEKIEHVITFINLIHPNLSHRDRTALDRVIRATYAKKDIFLEDPKSIYINGSDGEKKPMPILGDLYETIENNPQEKLDGILDSLERYVNGALKNFNQQTNVDLENKYIVIDVSELNDELMTIGMFIATTFANQVINADRTKAKAIIFDEAWRVLNSETDKSGEVGKFVETIARTIRGLGGSAIFATQDIKDLLKNDRARSILTQSESKLILKMQNFEADAAQEILNLNDEEKRRIVKAEKGEGILCVGNSRIGIQITGSEKERKLITTSRMELEKIAKERQNLKENGN